MGKSPLRFLGRILFSTGPRFLAVPTVLMMILYASMAGAEDTKTQAALEVEAGAEADQLITDRIHLFANCGDVGLDVHMNGGC